MTATGIECRAAIQWAPTDGWSIETIQLDEPRDGEVRVRMEAAGLCRTDHHLVEGGYPDVVRPVIGGHEGAGVIDSVGPGVSDLAVGDRVVLCIPVPACGSCAACLAGTTYLCVRGALTGAGRQVLDGTSRHHARGVDLGILVFTGTFSEYTVVSAATCHRVDQPISAVDVCSVSCAGVTGWGAVQNTAGMRAGEVVVVVGVGGVGANSLMAARYLGARAVLAIDPVPAKGALALGFGADAAAQSLEEAAEMLGPWTHGRMADIVVMTVDNDALVSGALALLGNRGRLIIVGSNPTGSSAARVNLRELQIAEKQIRGCYSGSWHGRQGVAFLLDLAARGRYEPGRIVDATWTLDQLEAGYARQLAGDSVRGVIRFDA
jgi:Zn-dependent alcohol dehydrogenase